MNEELDFDAMLQEFEEEWSDQEETVEETETETESESEIEDQEETETEEEPQEPQEQEQPNPNDEDAEKRNRAFADLRRQAEENRKYAEFIQNLANKSGVAPEELIKRYEERQLEEEAQRQQVPVEMLKRQQATESELSTLKDNMRAERFNMQVDSVIAKYGADDDSVKSAIQFMLQSGIDPRTTDNINFENFYRAANLDSIIEKEVNQSRQKDLEDKKKRQQNASIANGQSVSPSSETDWSDEDFDAELAKLGIKL